MLKKYSKYIALIFILVFISCTETSRIQIWQPWTRTFQKDTIHVQPKSKIALVISGETKSLIGNESMLQEELGAEVKSLLERRGFIIGADNPEYTAKFYYKTERHDVYNNTLQSYSSYNDYSYTYPHSKNNLGVALAALIAAASPKSENYVSASSKTVESYNHMISLEIYDRQNKSVFKGESIWDSRSLDIKEDCKTALKIILSSLPSEPGIYPYVQEVQESKKENYYTVKCGDLYFSCPALPYKISFLHYYRYPDHIIKDPSALEAYVDLMLTAENALPVNENYYNDPLSSRLWDKVQLGGKYYIGKDSTPKNILINLSGNYSGGYTIDKCWIATDTEYSAFESKMKKWNSVISDYYNFYSE